MRALNDPDLVRREYADETRLAVRTSIWETATGPDAKAHALGSVAEVEPRRVLDVGCGRGELAERLARELGADVVGLDRSPRMVELTRARGVEAVRGDVQALPFRDSSFDCVVAAWMLYHVPDLDRGLAEIRRVLRPGGRLAAVTNGDDNLRELWALFGDRARRSHPFSAENGEEILRRHFPRVDRRDALGVVRFPDWESARSYVAASTSRSHLADELRRFEGPLEARRLVAVFVCDA